MTNVMQGEVLVGLTGQGNRSDQLNQPTDLEFDSDGPLYASDWNTSEYETTPPVLSRLTLLSLILVRLN